MADLQELMERQINWEVTRAEQKEDDPKSSESIWELNKDKDFAQNRLMDEVKEWMEASGMNEVEEAVDILIYVLGLVAHTAVRNGVGFEEMEMAFEKMKSTEKKYSVENFANRTLKEGIIFSREEWAKSKGFEP